MPTSPVPSSSPPGLSGTPFRRTPASPTTPLERTASRRQDADLAVGATVHGYPRQGPQRQLKRAVEAYWADRLDAAGLLRAAEELRAARTEELRAGGLTEIPSNDFSLYDHVLDTAVLFGAIPARHRRAVPTVRTEDDRLRRYFAMARGTAEVEPLEMTKWFDTNYHYLVPELTADQEFALDASKVIAELTEHTEAGVASRPVILGPVSFLLLAKCAGPEFDRLSLLDRLLPLYADLFALLGAAGASWVQIDEPVLGRDLQDGQLDAFEHALEALTGLTHRPKLVLASYFGRLGPALPLLVGSDIDGLALDLVADAGENLTGLVEAGGLGRRRLLAGVVDGRNIWATDLDRALGLLAAVRPWCGQLDVSSSCSLLHVPIDVELEIALDAPVRDWLAFARQKLAEITALGSLLAASSAERPDEGGDGDGDGDGATPHPALLRSREIRTARLTSALTSLPDVRRRCAPVDAGDLRRAEPYDVRRDAQRTRLELPSLPTTTIGSFPQTPEVRRARSARRSGALDETGYRAAMRAEIDRVIALQERLGLDVLVHGEPERNDMVQYFAEQLDGFASTEHGWVQSYGTRCVRPPILFGDVRRPEPMTVDWISYAQGRTDRPVKGMLTGPVTMLAWSFVRDDLPVAEVARQVALALRNEVADLEASGAAVIQVDEPALRETLPLREADTEAYLTWAVDAFRLTTAGVADGTQIHTHMCYADFTDILSAIVAMDADVISLEAARSAMSIVGELAEAEYPREAGPGVWDIHSPRVPATGEIADRIRSATAEFPAERLWVNPDCGLKTRGYAEVEATLAHLVEAAVQVRAELA